MFAGIGIDGMAAGWDYDLAETNLEDDVYEFDLQVIDLDEDTDYECQFLICNTDALWPTC